MCLPTRTHTPSASYIHSTHVTLYRQIIKALCVVGNQLQNNKFQSQRGSITWLRYKESSLWGVGREGALYPASIYDNHCTHLEVVDDSCHTQPHAPWPLAPRKWLQEKAHKFKPSAQEMHARSVYVHLMHELARPHHATWLTEPVFVFAVCSCISEYTCTTGLTVL